MNGMLVTIIQSSFAVSIMSSGNGVTIKFCGRYILLLNSKIPSQFSNLSITILHTICFYNRNPEARTYRRLVSLFAGGAALISSKLLYYSLILSDKISIHSIENH